jgi:NAD(P)-dependent dehydrogenase (short-subunit alcohol dehydrogenase family)
MLEHVYMLKCERIIGAVLAKPSKNWVFIAGGAGAVDGITRALAVDLAPIRVNTIAPGMVSVSK